MQTYYYNLKGKALPEIQPGQTVRMKKPNENTWTEAVWKKMIGPRSYAVVAGNRTYRRNRRQLHLLPPVENPLARSEQPRDMDGKQHPIQFATPTVSSGEATPVPVNPKATVAPVNLPSSSTVTRSGCTV